MIKLIETSKLWPHPNNPRKDLGDLTELAESIKVSGIFQNLTVVPWFSETTGVGADDPKQQEEMGYRVIIGHRRLAAAKLAGLKKVPCSIAKMDKKTQVGTMLLENMQRSDLTILEQAEGFQMMIDFGESVSNISQKTGFSETTVRRRVKLLDLDKDKFKESAVRGGTLMDYMELDKIKNIELKNKVLEQIGTNNFNWALQDALRQEKAEENKAALIKQLETFAEQVTTDEGMSFIRRIYCVDKDFEKPDDAEKEEYFFILKQGYIDLLKQGQTEDAEGENTENKDDETEKRLQAATKKQEMSEISKKAFELRFEFVKNYPGSKKHIYHIAEFMTKVIINEFNCFYGDNFCEIMGVDLGEDEILDFAKIQGYFSKSPEKLMMATAYCNIGDSERNNYFNWQSEHTENEELDLIYDFLGKIGYEMSDEEKALQNKTHEFFQ